MILTIGVDNTNILIGCFSGESVVFTADIETDRKRTDIEYAISLKSILDLYQVPLSQIEGSIMASVVPMLTAVIKNAVKLLIHRDPLVVGPGVKNGLSILSDNMSTLGSDLVSMAAGAVAEYPAPMIIVELETATVLMAVDGNKRFVGSVIAPGVKISANALAAECDSLPQVSLEAPKEFIGRNTADCMRSGIIFGTAAMLDGMTQRIEEQLGSKCTIVATGSLASTIVPHCRREMILDELLFLKGLYRIYQRNAKRA